MAAHPNPLNAWVRGVRVPENDGEIFAAIQALAAELHLLSIGVHFLTQKRTQA